MRNKRKRFYLVAAVLLISMFLSLSVTAGQSAEKTVAAGLQKKSAAIIRKVTKKSDTKRNKLKKLFTYGETKWGYRRDERLTVENAGKWESFAKTMLYRKEGNCYQYAAGYAYLAKTATGYPVRIALGRTSGFSKDQQSTQDHAWTEIKIKGKWYICDVNLDLYAAGCSGRYFLKERKKMKGTYDYYRGVTYITVVK